MIGRVDTTPSETFPRGTALPKQSPLHWADNKDRYLRQLAIRDIEAITGRSLIVYYTDCGGQAQIDQYDDKYLLEVLGDTRSSGVDLLLETNGGQTDAAEKIVSIITAHATDLRVIIPRRAKSNGTLIALAAREIIMGQGSELGPIDPHLMLPPGVAMPCQFIINSAPGTVDPVLLQHAHFAVLQTKKLAGQLLANGMLKGKEKNQIDDLIEKLSTKNVYHSHGSVISPSEAKYLGLNVNILPHDSDLWKWFWLLRCMYDADARTSKVIKIFEGARVSNSIKSA